MFSDKNIKKVSCFFSSKKYQLYTLREMLKIIHFYHFVSDPRFPPFYYMLGGNLGSLLYGDVSVMVFKTLHIAQTCLGNEKYCIF